MELFARILNHVELTDGLLPCPLEAGARKAAITDGPEPGSGLTFTMPVNVPHGLDRDF